jgi:LEA14-like dessication related protein
MKTKTALYILSAVVAVGALALYFRRQVKLALEWDYRIKKISIKNFTKESAELEGVITFINKSNFNLKVFNYDLSFYYNQNLLGNTKSSKEFVVLPDTSFDVPIEGNLLFTGVKASLLPFATAVVRQKPIDVALDGVVSFEVGGIKKTLPLNMVEIEYSSDLAKELGFESPLEKGKTKISQLLGIKF